MDLAVLLDNAGGEGPPRRGLAPEPLARPDPTSYLAGRQRPAVGDSPRGSRHSREQLVRIPVTAAFRNQVLVLEHEPVGRTADRTVQLAADVE